MNKKLLILLISIVFLVLCFTLLWIYRDGLFSSFKGNEMNSAKNNIYNESENYLEDIDNSEKVAKLYRTLDSNNKEFEKEISQNEIDKISKMIESNEFILAMISFANLPDFIIEYNNSKESIGFRIQNEYILAVINTSRVYIIYKENDVRELLSILSTNLKDNLQYTEININEVATLPDIYVNYGHKTLKGSSILPDEKSSYNIKDMKIKLDEVLKGFETVETFTGPIISTNKEVNGSPLIKLPNTAKITYTVYKGEDIIFTKEAERMINGSYHFEQPNINGEYIYAVFLNFTNFPNINEVYYFKLKR